MLHYTAKPQQMLKCLLVRQFVRREVNKGNIMKRIVLYIFAIHILLIGITCFACSADELEDQALSLFGEAQKASVFYLDNGMEVILIENHASP